MKLHVYTYLYLYIEREEIERRVRERYLEEGAENSFLECANWSELAHIELCGHELM